MTHHGLQQYKKKPLALKNAPVTFQSAINATMALARGKTSVMHLDEAVLSKDPEQHIHEVGRVLRLMSEA